MIALIPTLLLLFAGCERGGCPNGSMLDSDEGLVVTEAEHPEGWGQGECAACHALGALHQTSCTPDVDLVELRDEITAYGVEVCADCHGDNGVGE